MYYPLSQTQLGVLLAELNNSGEGTYNNTVLFTLDEAVELSRLKDAAEKAGNNHPMLKARLCSDEAGHFSFVPHDEELFRVGRAVRHQSAPVGDQFDYRPWCAAGDRHGADLRGTGRKRSPC